MRASGSARRAAPGGQTHLSARSAALVERALQDDRAELAFDADEVFGADREADAFGPGAGEADLGDFASRGARALASARAEQARGDLRASSTGGASGWAAVL